jgi:hypothetical protein
MVGALLVPALPAEGAKPSPAADPAVISAWNGIAMTTIAGPAPTGAGKANAEAFLWLSFVHTAVYNAVVGITGEYQLYQWKERGPQGASPQAAAAAAAHGVLMEYFGSSNPTIAANLDAALVTSLTPIPDGEPKAKGIRYGGLAADHIISLREDDGRFAPITFDVPPAAGVWRPTPPGFAPFFDPWLGQVDPLVLHSLDQFRPGPPPAIDSDVYVEEFEEVRDYGVATDSLRSDEQTETARFFSDTGVGPLQAALRDRAMRHGQNISDTARLFAAVEASLADAIGAVWDAKYHYGWWRPITAIREADTDGNPDTAGVADWTPLIVTPPYPDWPSGLAGVIGAVSTTLVRLDGAVDLYITSAAAGAPGLPVTRHYATAAEIQQDVIDARVWSGIHFRTADEVGMAMGIQVGTWTLDHYFGRGK